MSDSSDTSAIDDKKDDSSTASSIGANLGQFIFTTIILFIMVILYYVSSGLILYACKLAQSNILPTNVHCYPYLETKPNIEPIQTNIFTTFTDPQLSMKLNFPYDKYNSANKILDMFRDYKNEPRSNFLANYFISLMEAVIQFNYTSLNSVLNGLNSLPELLIVLFGPIILAFVSTLLFICDHIYLIYLWFANMGWFFKKNVNSGTTGYPQWEEVGFIDLFNFNYFCAVCLVILFFVLFFFSLPLLSVIAAISMGWCMFSCITYKSQMNGKNATSFSVIQDFFKFYKVLIMGIVSFFVITTTFSSLGVVAGIFSLVTLALICFGFIAIDIFKPMKPDDLSPVVSFEQAKKTCPYVEPSRAKHGLLYHLLFGFNQKGGNITKELKNIGKKLSRK
jgi:hypothetical protein